MVIRFRTYSYICGDHIGYPTNNRLSGLHNQSPQRNEMSKCYIRSTYMVGGWWVVDTIPFQNIYFSSITLGDDLLVLFPMPLIQNSQLAGLFSEWRLNLSQTHTTCEVFAFISITQEHPFRKLIERGWEEGREEEKSSSMMMISESGGVSDLSAPLYLET